MAVEISSHGFYQALPEHLRGIIDMMTRHFLPETWPVRFLALISMLEEMTEQVEQADRLDIVNNWLAIVSGLLERLPRDMTSPECLTLMRHCVLEPFRQSATRHSRDVSQQDELLRSKYPQWVAVEELLEEYEALAAQKLRLTRH
ncbi:hypothetical protein [Rhizobium binae]|uniref:hypothetical protein n=1 Tax=Rhizobium binae TaxID=1138190 RepID=UPI002180A6B0|nr:hypothetical protein [Rhizobium binae]